MMRVAILDDYAKVSQDVADWSAVAAKADIQVFSRHLSESEAVTAFADFDVLCTVRERMAFPRSLFEKLPKLKAITIIGQNLANLDMQAATDHGVLVITNDNSAPNPAFKHIAYATPELTWGLIITTRRHLVDQEQEMRNGGWQTKTGTILAGQTLGILGLGRIGKRVARYAQAFDMNVIAWSQNLTAAAAAEVGVKRVEKTELFAQSDILSVHVVLSDRTRGLVTGDDLSLMKPTATLINTARAAIVDQAALLSVLQEHRIASAGLDVFDTEPLPTDHPFRKLSNVTIVPHIGYATNETLGAFYEGKIKSLLAYLDGSPTHIANPEALEHAKHRA